MTQPTGIKVSLLALGIRSGTNIHINPEFKIDWDKCIRPMISSVVLRERGGKLAMEGSPSRTYADSTEASSTGLQVQYSPARSHCVAAPAGRMPRCTHVGVGFSPLRLCSEISATSSLSLQRAFLLIRSAAFGSGIVPTHAAVDPIRRGRERKRIDSPARPGRPWPSRQAASACVRCMQ